MKNIVKTLALGLLCIGSLVNGAHWKCPNDDTHYETYEAAYDECSDNAYYADSSKAAGYKDMKNGSYSNGYSKMNGYRNNNNYKNGTYKNTTSRFSY